MTKIRSRSVGSRHPEETHRKRLNTIALKYEIAGGKICRKCSQLKPLFNFGFRSGKHAHLYRAWCKACETKEFSAYQKKRRDQANRRRTSKIDEWKIWLTEKYGLNPICQCCGRVLTWSHGNKEDSAILDHRLEGREPIREGFYTWAGDRKVSDENIGIVEQCNFGLLCRKCNMLIPTYGRQEWLLRLGKYLNGQLN